VELRHYLAILRRRILFIALATVAALAAAWIATPQDARYSAETVIYVGARQLVDPNQQIRSDPLLAAERLTKTFALMIDSEPIARDALELSNARRSPGAIVRQTTVTGEPGTQLLRVRVTDASPAVARDLANGMARAFVDRVQDFEPGVPGEVGDVPALPAYVFQEAGLPVRPQPTDIRRNLVVAGLFGLMASAAVVLLVEYLDVTIKSAADAEHRLELPVLGTVPMARQGLLATPWQAAKQRPLRGQPRVGQTRV
jgi:polysaccharide biosynthesis transport protein